MYKNPRTAFWLSLFFGPIGYIYVNPAHAAIMILIVIVTGGAAGLIVWPISFMMASQKAKEYNSFINGEKPPIPSKKAKEVPYHRYMVYIGLLIVAVLLAILLRY